MGQTVTQMNTRAQSIWDTSRTITAVRDENAAFDPLSNQPRKEAVENAQATLDPALQQRGLGIVNGGAVGNVEEDMPGVVLAMNDLSKDWRPGDDKTNCEEVKRGSLKLMEMTGGDNSMENFPQFAHILEALKVLDYSDCNQLSGDLQALQSLNQLTHLNLDSCWELTGDLQPLQNLNQLTYLNLRSCKDLIG